MPGCHFLESSYPKRLPENLELEIVETTALADLKHAERELGVHIALDESGSGYSSCDILSPMRFLGMFAGSIHPRPYCWASGTRLKIWLSIGFGRRTLQQSI
jgi:hypothetical protein